MAPDFRRRCSHLLCRPHGCWWANARWGHTVTVAASSHTPVGRSDTWKVRPAAPAAAWCSHSLGDKERWLLLQNAVKNGGGCPKAPVAIPAPPLPLVVAEAAGWIPPPAVLPLFPWQDTVQTSPLSPGSPSSIGLRCWKPLIQFWEIPAAPLYWAEATNSYHPLSSGLPRNSFPYKSHLAFQHGALLTETTILRMLQWSSRGHGNVTENTWLPSAALFFPYPIHRSWPEHPDQALNVF